jgi:nucleoporin NUP1
LPVKHQHASLLFNKSNEDEIQNDGGLRPCVVVDKLIYPPVPAERALQQLDIYKTPLLPSRMRSDADSITANVIPDMFKSRRASRPVLISDDREKSNAKKNGPIVNETKPYAGQGGMKKLLARAKLEAEKEMANEKDDGQTIVEVSEPPLPPPPPPPLVTSDWFNNAVSGTSASSSGSSLRVGRQKTSRHHFQRPSKSRFSAVYEDEGDDAMEDDERAKERRMLEEAATKVPVFKVPSGFTFAKDVSFHHCPVLWIADKFHSFADPCSFTKCR